MEDLPSRPAKTQAEADERRYRLLDATGVLSLELLRGSSSELAAALSLSPPRPMLDDLSTAFLIAVDRLTRDSYDETDGSQVRAELAQLGHKPEGITLYNLTRRLKNDGYIDAYMGAGMDFDATALMSVTPAGREAVFDVEPLDLVQADARRSLTSPAFARGFPEAYDAWAKAEALWQEDPAGNLTAIGHHVREAMQHFANGLVAAYRPTAADPDPSKVERRLGAVVAMHGQDLGAARGEALNALAELWEKTNRLVQRQEHGAQKEGEPLTESDARRIILLAMVCMVEFAETFAELDPPTLRA